MPIRGDDGRESQAFGDLFVEYTVVLPEEVEGDMKKGKSKSERWKLKVINSNLSICWS